MTDEARQFAPKNVSHATPQQQLDFLADEVRKALACFDRMPLPKYFDLIERGDPIALAILGAFDHLSPALNILGLTDKPLTNSQRPEAASLIATDRGQLSDYQRPHDRAPLEVERKA